MCVWRKGPIISGRHACSNLLFHSPGPLSSHSSFPVGYSSYPSTGKPSPAAVSYLELSSEPLDSLDKPFPSHRRPSEAVWGYHRGLFLWAPFSGNVTRHDLWTLTDNTDATAHTAEHGLLLRLAAFVPMRELNRDVSSLFSSSRSTVAFFESSQKEVTKLRR